MSENQEESGLKVHLPCDKEVEIFVRHKKNFLVRRWEKPKEPVRDEKGNLLKKVLVDYMVRGTTVRMIMDGLEYEAHVRCSPEDNCSYAQGRKLAANRLLVLLRDKARFPNLPFTKEDHRIIFLAICPEFLRKEVDKKLRRKARNLARQLIRNPEKMVDIAYKTINSGE